MVALLHGSQYGKDSKLRLYIIKKNNQRRLRSQKDSSKTKTPLKISILSKKADLENAVKAIEPAQIGFSTVSRSISDRAVI